MKLAVFENFLTKGSAQIPSYPGLRGVGIHSASEVESFEIGGIRVGIKAIAPLGGQGGQQINATRIGLVNSGGIFSGTAGVLNPMDGNKNPGEKLVLQLYECDDELNIPGARAPYLTRAYMGALPVTAGAAQLMMRLPMSGRTRATVSWTGSAAGGATIGLVGLRALYGINKGEMPILNPTTYTASGTLGTFGPANGATIYTRQIYVDNESYDDLLVFAWDANGGQCLMIAECTGERLT